MCQRFVKHTVILSAMSYFKHQLMNLVGHGAGICRGLQCERHAPSNPIEGSDHDSNSLCACGDWHFISVWKCDCINGASRKQTQICCMDWCLMCHPMLSNWSLDQVILTCINDFSYERAHFNHPIWLSTWYSPSVASKARSAQSAFMRSNYLLHKQHGKDPDGEWVSPSAWVSEFFILSLECHMLLFAMRHHGLEGQLIHFCFKPFFCDWTHSRNHRFDNHDSIPQFPNLSFSSVLLYWFCNKDSILWYHDCVSIVSIGFLSFVSFLSAVTKVYITFYQLRFSASLDMLCSHVSCSCNARAFIRRSRTGLCCWPESSGLQVQTFASLCRKFPHVYGCQHVPRQS